MTTASGHSRQSGFTIQELVVVILVGSLLLGFSYSLYLFVAGFVQEHMTKRWHEEIVDRTAAFLIADAEKSRFVRTTDSAIVVDHQGRELITYRMGDGKLWRNEMLIAGSGDSFWRLSAGRSAMTVEFTITGRWKNDSASAACRVSAPWSSYGAMVSELTPNPSLTKRGGR